MHLNIRHDLSYPGHLAMKVYNILERSSYFSFHLCILLRYKINESRVTLIILYYILVVHNGMIISIAIRSMIKIAQNVLSRCLM